MPNYYVQSFSYDGPGQSLCYGAMGAHDHDQSNQFTTDVMAYLQAQGATNIKPGNFQSNQGAPAVPAKEFRWDNSQSKWVKA